MVLIYLFAMFQKTIHGTLMNGQTSTKFANLGFLRHPCLTLMIMSLQYANLQYFGKLNVTSLQIYDLNNCHCLCSDLGEDLKTLNEAEQLAKIVTSGRDTYRQRQLGHGLILLKLSKVQEKLGKCTEAYQNKNEALQIVTICIGETLAKQLCQL